MKNVIITGASRGIGRSLVEFFLHKGHAVIALSRNIQALEKNYPREKKLKCYAIDITNESEVTALVESISQEVYIDILINNAGLLINKSIIETTIEDMNQQMAVNFIAPARLIQLLSERFNPRSAHVVNITSMGGIQGSSKFPGLAIYSSVKGALNVLTECLAVEFQDSNTKFNALALGAVQTEMLAEAFPDYKAPMKSSEMAEFIGDFALSGDRFFNGKIVQVALDNP